MTPRFTHPLLGLLCLVLIGFTNTSSLKAEEDDETYQEETKEEATENRLPEPPPKVAAPKKNKKKDRRKYVTDHPERSDAGIFYVAAAAGGNFYVEPKVNATTKAPLGEYFKDFGFQGGAYFDYDYSQMAENIPLSLRGFLGYKYILSSAHVFTFDGVVRRMFNFSEKVTFGLGMGGSAAIWYRSITDTSPEEEIIFLPSLIITAGFEFNPFMVDFKWLINKFGSDATVTGIELYFGFRL